MITIKSVSTRWPIFLFLLGAFVILSIVACTEPVAEEAAYPEEAPEPQEAITEEAPEEQAIEKGTVITLTMAVPEYLTSEDFVDGVFAPFEENTGIGLEIIPRGDDPGATTADVGVLSYNELASLVNEERLQSLNQLEAARSRDFVNRSLELHTFFEQIYGLPWLRSGCAPAYENLSAFNLDKQAAIDSLFLYLTETDTQLQINEMRGWLPTTEQAYGELGLNCETVNLLPLDPALVEETINQMEQSAEALQGVLGDQVLAPEAATAVPVGGEIVARVAPVAINMPDDEAMERLSSVQGVTVGAVSLLEGAELDMTDDYDARPGDYAVTCRQEGEEMVCTLTSPEKGVIQVFAARFQVELPSAVLPAVSAEEGSSHGCFWLDGFHICLRFG